MRLASGLRLAAIRGPTSKGREGKGEGEGEGKGGSLLLREGNGEGRKGEEGGKGKDERPPVQSKNFLRKLPARGRNVRPGINTKVVEH